MADTPCPTGDRGTRRVAIRKVIVKSRGDEFCLGLGQLVLVSPMGAVLSVSITPCVTATLSL